MPGIPRELAEQSLKVHKDARPVKQSMRRFSGPKRDTITMEVDRLLHAKFIREIKDSDWVANPVLVEKKKTKNYACALNSLQSTCAAPRITSRSRG